MCNISLCASDYRAAVGTWHAHCDSELAFYSTVSYAVSIVLCELLRHLRLLPKIKPKRMMNQDTHIQGLWKSSYELQPVLSKGGFCILEHFAQ